MIFHLIIYITLALALGIAVPKAESELEKLQDLRDEQAEEIQRAQASVADLPEDIKINNQIEKMNQRKKKMVKQLGVISPLFAGIQGIEESFGDVLGKVSSAVEDLIGLPAKAPCNNSGFGIESTMQCMGQAFDEPKRRNYAMLGMGIIRLLFFLFNFFVLRKLVSNLFMRILMKIPIIALELGIYLFISLIFYHEEIFELSEMMLHLLPSS